ncbi:MAG: hypothetical protein JOZ02_15425 [Acidobacteria bacterium]|nr:hypothetical protein [Acidobacteriota bacterium]
MTDDRRSTLRAAACAALLCLTFAADARAQAGGGDGETLPTKSGTLGIFRVGDEADLKWELRLGKKTVLQHEGSSFVHFEAFFPNLSQGEVAIVSFNSGGQACPAQFRVVRVVSADKVEVSEEFGDCSDSPTVTLKQLPEEELTFGFPGYYQLWQSQEPGFRRPPPTTWVYRKGVLRELKPAATKKR